MILSKILIPSDGLFLLFCFVGVESLSIGLIFFSLRIVGVLFTVTFGRSSDG